MAKSRDMQSSEVLLICFEPQCSIYIYTHTYIHMYVYSSIYIRIHIAIFIELHVCISWSRSCDGAAVWQSQGGAATERGVLPDLRTVCGQEKSAANWLSFGP